MAGELDRLRCTVFVGISLDGMIARSDERLDFLDGPDGAGPGADDDGGYAELLASVDGLVMGRRTYDVVRRLVDEWPYDVPVVVLTSRPIERPAGHDVRTASGTPEQVAAGLVADGWTHAYVDGAAVVQQFLRADLVDRIVLTTVPVLVGTGVRLFGDVPADRWFRAAEPRLLGSYVQTTFERVGSV